MDSRLWYRRGPRLGAVAAAVVLALGLSGFIAHRTVWAAADQTRSRTSLTAAPPALPASPLLVEMENAFTAIADRVQPAVVMIRVERSMRSADSDMPDIRQLFPNMPGMPDQMPFQFPRTTPRTFRAQGAGSGVIVRSDGWILTNDHVVGGADKVTVKLQDGRELPGTVRRDFRSDLALVKVNANNLPTAALGDSDRLRVGQWVLAFGAPYELSDTMTVGVVSAMHRQTTIGAGQDARSYSSLIQTDAAINPGNSGGPLVNIRGQVVGIDVAINSPNGGSVGIGFAIPANTARSVMDQLITTGKVTRGYLGISMRDLTDEDQKRYGATKGVLVAEVQPDTPASRAGVQVEDVIVRLNGEPVPDRYALSDLIARARPGSAFDMVVRRGGKEVTLRGTLTAMPESVAMGEVQPGPRAAVSTLGLRVQPIAPEASRRLNLGANAGGVQVAEVQSGSAADSAGVQPGDVVLRVNGRTVRTPAEFTTAASGAKSGDTVNLVIARDRSRMLVTLQVP